MKVLLFVGGSTDPQRLESTLQWLGGRGAAVHVLVDAEDAEVYSRLEQASGAVAGVRCSPAPIVPFTAWSYTGGEILRGIVHLEAGGRQAPDFVSDAVRRTMFSSPLRRRLFAHGLRWYERAVPREPAVDAAINAESPDLLCIMTPPERGGVYLDYLRSARARGVHAVVYDDAKSGADLEAAVDAAVTGRRPRLGVPSWVERLGRRLAARLATRLASSPDARRIKVARQDAVRRRRQMEAFERRARLVSNKQRSASARALRKQALQADREAVRVAAERALAQTYERYLQVRSWARRMHDRSAGSVVLTESECRTAAALAPLWDASLETIAHLRHWSEPMTGVRAADYAPVADELNHMLRREFYVLHKEIGSSLMVPEPALLGGFGVVRSGIRINEETLHNFHAIAALNDGAVLQSFRTSKTRRIVWEIGGGWGGFAYQFKTLCPNVTYVITGLPVELLVSAVYLAGVFPSANVRFFDEHPGDLWEELDGVDFVFAPESALTGLRPPCIELTLDLARLRSMTTERAAAHVRQAFDWGARYIYSMLPVEPAGSDAEIPSAIEPYYWIHPIPPRALESIARKHPDTPSARFTHFIGWKRLRT